MVLRAGQDGNVGGGLPIVQYRAATVTPRADDARRHLPYRRSLGTSC